MTLRLTEVPPPITYFRAPNPGVVIHGISYISAVYDYIENGLPTTPIPANPGKGFVIGNIIYHLVEYADKIDLVITVFDPENPDDRLVVFVDCFLKLATTKPVGTAWGFLEDGPWVDTIGGQIIAMKQAYTEFALDHENDLKQKAMAAKAEHSAKLAKFRNLFPKGV